MLCALIFPFSPAPTLLFLDLSDWSLRTHSHSRHTDTSRSDMQTQQQQVHRHEQGGHVATTTAGTQIQPQQTHRHTCTGQTQSLSADCRGRQHPHTSDPTTAHGYRQSRCAGTRTTAAPTPGASTCIRAQPTPAGAHSTVPPAPRALRKERGETEPRDRCYESLRFCQATGGLRGPGGCCLPPGLPAEPTFTPERHFGPDT